MFRLFGFDVRVRAGFLVFLALIVFLYQNAFGLWLAAGIAVFTLLHELGHATAARSAGAEASISLDFLAGYTSFRERPGETLTRPERALITAAGPVVQIVASVGLLAAMGVNPLSFDSIRQSEAAAALWWAGPMIGALNLIPVLPLDGGHLALVALESLLGQRAQRVMVVSSLVITAGGAVWLYLSGRGDFAVFIVFLLISQMQMLGATNRVRGRVDSIARLSAAEATAWRTGQPGMLEPGQRLSPWWEAHRALQAGDADGARRAILADLASDRPARWAAPAAADPAALRAIVGVLPTELPHGNQFSERVLCDVLLALGDYPRAGRYAVEGYPARRASTTAVVVARAAAAMGDDVTAMQWLEAAVDDTLEEADYLGRLLAVVMDRAAEFARLRPSPDFHRLRARLNTSPHGG